MTAALFEAYEAVLSFFDAGGWVLKPIFAVTLIMWVLIGERLWYLRWGYKHDQEPLLERWRARVDKASWASEQIRTRLVSVMKQKLNHSLPMVATLVAVCPLFGLLGTVTGMIEVFDIMAIAGNSNPRAMAGTLRSLFLLPAGAQRREAAATVRRSAHDHVR